MEVEGNPSQSLILEWESIFTEDGRRLVIFGLPGQSHMSSDSHRRHGTFDRGGHR